MPERAPRPGHPPPPTPEDLARVLPITGYLDRVSARPGDQVAAMVSAQGGGTYSADVVRILSADPNPDGPGMIFEPVDFGLEGTYPARQQGIELGSYAVMPTGTAYTPDQLELSVLVQPWLLRDTPSVLMAAQDADGHGWALTMTADSVTLTLCDEAGQSQSVTLRPALPLKGWARLRAGWDRPAGTVWLSHQPWPEGPAKTAQDQLQIGPLPAATTLTLAAHRTGAQSQAHFNGRLEAPCLTSAGTPLARWDFSIGIDTQTVTDTGPHGLHGRLINVPTRAVRGAHWQPGGAMDWQTAPQAYAAIHFHEDDLHDCGWQTDFTLTIPANMPSGCYGLRLTKGDAQDILPFYTRPAPDAPRARVCVLASTFTHQAYGNHARGNCDAALRARMADWRAPPNADDYPIYGRSTYNLHPDGSGVCFASRLRPVLTTRPGYLTFDDPAGSGLRHFPADSHLHAWLHARGIAFDVVTDEDLDREGAAALQGYAVLLTGSHPEYHTNATLDAITGFRAQGGNLMYLGGNGFYWRIAHVPQMPGLIELRRAEGGIRAWAAEPGEYYHQLDGGYGGLWRRNGRPPQAVGGVGFSAQGLFRGSHYRRTPASHAPDLAWMFDGVSEENLGDYGLSGGGAAGFELDRADTALGTPDTAVILARSEGHDDSFVTVPEELLSHLSTVTGEPPADLVRAEIIYVPPAGTGALFATGSITYCGSLTHNAGDNGISRLTENVLRRFAGL